MTPPRLFFVAAEASGDLLAREVIETVREMAPEATISGIGGAEMQAVGVSSPIDIAPLSILGFFDGLKNYGAIRRLADGAADAIVAADPDVIVLVDSWGFMVRVAQRVRPRLPRAKIVKLIGPQVWATRPGRARTLAASVDHLLCMHDIEVPFYAPHGLKTTVIGNPALSRDAKGDGQSFRRNHEIARDAPLVLVLPGSRPGEIARVAPALVAAAREIKAARPDCLIAIAPAVSVRQQFDEVFPDIGDWAMIVSDPAERFDAMAAADLVLACSGTVTSEVAVQGTPLIVAYKTGWLTWAVARGLLYSKTHITLLNILNDDKEIVPEFVQTRQQAPLIAAKALSWLGDPASLSAQRAVQSRAVERMQPPGLDSARISAEAILAEAAIASR